MLLTAHARGIRIASTEERLKRFDRIALILELIVIVLFLISLGSVALAFLNAYGVSSARRGCHRYPDAVAYGSRCCGFPPHFRLRVTTLRRRRSWCSSGGFVLRVVVLLGSDQVHVAGAQVFR
jgi:hypothetical protein